MRLRELTLNLDDPGGATLKERVVRAVEKAVCEGRLKPGTLLPGSRNFAKDLGVARNTVLAALNELITEGWLVNQPWRGIFVAPKPPLGEKVGNPSLSPHDLQLGFDLLSFSHDISTGVNAINLADGLADSGLAPKEVMGRAYQRALKNHGKRLLDRGEYGGNMLLRETLSAWVSEHHGLTVGPERVVTTSGGISGVHLVCEALLEPGDVVAVEEPGNRTLWKALTRSRKVELCPLEVDAQGVVIESLEETLKKKTVRMICVTPRCQFPTGVVIGVDRAKRLLELTARHRIAIYEDDTDAAIQYVDQHSLPLLALDTTGQVIFSASLSALVAPGMRLGYLVIPAALASHLAKVRKALEAQGDRVSEWAFADLIRNDELARHLRRVRKIYEARRDHLCGLLRQELGAHLEFDVPSSGMALWLKSRGEVDMDTWIKRADKCGLQLKGPSHFYMGEAFPCTRMGFTQVDETMLSKAVERLKQALEKIR